jgi:hypothetical protein
MFRRVLSFGKTTSEIRFNRNFHIDYPDYWLGEFDALVLELIKSIPIFPVAGGNVGIHELIASYKSFKYNWHIETRESAVKALRNQSE